ncbi:MAG: SDR family oxidoreductase [Anaerolineaceae bacterium]|nr:SDR family oxidoreductase [Anaerolineaceae bacterium]
MEIKGKTALITGSAIRLGRAIALSLATYGCNLILHYHKSEGPALQLLKEVSNLGIEATLINSDLSNEADILSLFPQVYDLNKQVDILINNASVYIRANASETSLDIWNKQFALNIRAPFFLSKAFYEQLPSGKQGKIVNISDARVFHQQPDHFAYRLTKSALHDMTKMMAIEFAPRVTVNALALGIMLPLAGKENVDLHSLANSRIPLKRIGSPEIAAQNVLHILNQDFMTGEILRVDGGEFLL